MNLAKLISGIADSKQAAQHEDRAAKLAKQAGSSRVDERTSRQLREQAARERAEADRIRRGKK